MIDDPFYHDKIAKVFTRFKNFNYKCVTENLGDIFKTWKVYLGANRLKDLYILLSVKIF